MAKNECEHKNWKIQLDNRIGYGTCLNCDKEVPLSTLIVNVKKRLLYIISKFESKVVSEDDKLLLSFYKECVMALGLEL